MRTCFNAQEKSTNPLWTNSPSSAKFIPSSLAISARPCHIRAGITTPICTEGSHFCGIKVWLDFPNISRRI